jgi:hypothetical protein
MPLSTAILAIYCLFGVDPASTPDELDPSARAQWRRAFDEVAEGYKLIRTTDQAKLALVDRATYTWARSGAEGGTYGAVYVWTYRGNAEAVACFWRYAKPGGGLAIVHEWHSLSPAILTAETEVADTWTTKTGCKRQPVPDAPPVAETAVGRIQQMRTICRNFSAHSTGANGDRTELRLLPQPVYRFESTDPNVIDGGLFAFVCSIGTDPEVFLQLQANKSDGEPRWTYSLGRFSHMDLSVSYRDKEVWQALRDADNPVSHNADRTYWVVHQPFDRTLLKPAAEKSAKP